MIEKRFGIRADQIRPLAEGHGRCIATDRITVELVPVGYMCSEDPDDTDDSGWRFFAGDESDEYANDVANLGLYDVNTIANYAPDVIPHLNAPIGTAFIRDTHSGTLIMDTR